MDAAVIVRRARERAGLSKRELARRAGTSPAAIVHYEQGARDPGVETLGRILDAAGAGARIGLVRRGPDPVVAGQRLEQVLELADALPHRRAHRTLDFPPLARRA
jgi:transcriptional regulator with XRE-family HTH domain